MRPRPAPCSRGRAEGAVLRMEDRLGDLLQCEEQLRSTLHNNDKEKLRRKLALLQKEYLRTIQRLKRAERVELVRQHVRNRITLHNHHDQTNADVKLPGPSAAEQEGTKGPHPGVGQEGTKGPRAGVGQAQQQLSTDLATAVQKSPEKCTQTVRFSLVSDKTPDSSQGSSQIPKSSLSLRLRSRHSRLCWAERSAELDHNQEAPKNSRDVAEQGSHTARFNDPSVLQEDQELFPPSENMSPSLLLPHWNLQGHVERIETSNQQLTLEKEKESEEKPPNLDSFLPKEISENTDNCIYSPSHKRQEKEDTVNQRLTPEREVSNASLLLEVKDVWPHNDKHKRYSKLDVHENGKHQAEECKAEKEETVNNQLVLVKEVDIISNCNEKTPHFASLLIESNVSPLKDNHKLNSKLEEVNKNGTQQQSPTNTAEKTKPEDSGQRLLDSCTLVDGLLFPAEYYVRTTRRMSVSQSLPDMNAVILSHLHKGRQRRGRGRGRQLNRTVSVDRSILDVSKDVSENNEFFSGLSAGLDRSSVSAIPTSNRGKQGRRGRGRGRGRAKRRDDVNENTADPQMNDICVGLCPQKCAVMSVEPESAEVRPEEAGHEASTVTAKEAAQTLHGQEKGHIILQTNQSETNGEREKAEDWAGLLLPSLSQSELSALSSPLPCISLLKNLFASDIQDFHLPDDQFGSLKLLKLRRIICGVEPLISSSNNTATTDLCACSPALRPLSCSPAPQTDSEDALASPNSVLVEYTESHINKDTFKVSNQENLVGCSSPNILNTVSSPERKHLTNIFHLKAQDSVQQKIPNFHKDQIPSLNVKNSEGVTLKSVESVVEEVTNSGAQYKTATDIEFENQGQNDNKRATMHQNSDKADSKCLNTENSTSKKDNQTLSHQILQKNLSPLEKSPKNHMKNIQTNTKSNKSECEERNLSNEEKATPQLLLSPSLSSTPCPVTLPLVGFMNRPVVSALSPLPFLPAHSTTSEALSLSPVHLKQDQCEAPATHEPSLIEQSQQEARDDCTLKGGPGALGSLVDVCCVSSLSGSLSVAAAGKWAVNLWSQGQPMEWSLTHTWTFEEPVLCLFPIPDTPDWFCLTLGQLEIRQVRVLSCSTLAQTVLCTRPAHMAITAPKSRVVCCFHTPTSSTLQVFTLSDTRPPQVCALASPGALLSSLAPVDGLPDALIGMDHSDCLFIWNMGSGHLLKRISLGEAFSHSTCHRGYSSRGALFALMQHHLQGSQKKPGGGVEAEEGEPLFSLVAINPQNGKSVLATGLCAPELWRGRASMAAVDVLGSCLLGLSDRGSVCVWDLEHLKDPRPVCVPSGSQGWHLARWGSPGLLLTALLTGDVTLHHCTPGTTPTAIQSVRFSTNC